MPTTARTPVTSLALDLRNFRAMAQGSETEELRAIVSIDPLWFWALTRSLLEHGYLPNESIVVLKEQGKGRGKRPTLVVKEGNRRVGAVKLILGLIPDHDLDVPGDVQEAIDGLEPAWARDHGDLPCVIYDQGEKATVDRIVALIHGKEEQAGRAKWTAVARARHNRDMEGASEPGLDLLEKDLKQGKNLSDDLKKEWAGKYPLSVLDEAMKKIRPLVGIKTAREMANLYPKVKNRKELEAVLLAIGLETCTFPAMRAAPSYFTSKFGFPALSQVESNPGGSTPGSTLSPAQPGAQAQPPAGGSPGAPPPNPGPAPAPTAPPSSATGGSAKGGSATMSAGPSPAKGKALHPSDPKAIMKRLRDFKPVGQNRGKLVALRDEALKLDLNDHPHSFCFLFRSMLELSAKAYCLDHAASGGPSMTKASGDDRKLADVLDEICLGMTNNNKDKAAAKRLHSAMVELKVPEGILSVTSLNQLIHNPNLVINASYLGTPFHNIFPLLEAMN